MKSLGLSYYILQKSLLNKDDPEINERLIQCQAALLDMMIRDRDDALCDVMVFNLSESGCSDAM